MKNLKCKSQPSLRARRKAKIILIAGLFATALINYILFAFIIFPLTLVYLVVGVIIYNGRCFSEIFVATDRIYGKANFKKQIDLPLSSISGVALKSESTVVVFTNAGSFTFSCIENANEVCEAIGELLREKQA